MTLPYMCIILSLTLGMLEIQEESILCTSLFTPAKIESIISFNFGHLHLTFVFEIKEKKKEIYWR